MHPNRVAENVFGTLGTICWTAQLVPQVWKSYREKSTEGLSEWLVLCWGLAGGFFGVYAVVQDLNIPLILQPEIFAFLCLVSWGQCQYYSSTRPKYISFIIAVITIALLGGFEAGMVFAIRPSLNPRAIQFFGIFSSVLLATGLVTQYYEIYQRKEVVGLSITFMVVDCLGGVFSDLSLAFKSEFDTIAAVTYTLVIVMDGMVLLAAAILNPRARKRRERLQEAQDNVPHDNPSEISAIPLTTSQRRSSANSEHRGGLPAE
ncbi:PQ loop repeat-domain-containing protein [Mycena rosella]|uniref:PQ loop repeat-domain-containing protein n=1 Tax=Mycena rosella TaxID=1033263 RepID=A0AAD7CW49_MYCRO|nr:PQ loop repeat-domain-containing protein [Mycena rosella]